MQTRTRKLIVAALAVAVCVIAGGMFGTVTGKTPIQQQQFTGNEQHVISLSDAVRFIKNYRSNPKAPSIQGAYLGRNIFEKILAQPGCVGIRYYYAAMDDGTPTIVLVGVNAAGADLDSGILGEQVFPCPPFCGPPSQLTK
jgi:hypothetical protein